MNCVWLSAEEDSYFETSCGHTFMFMDDGIKENHFQYCPYCQKPIVESTEQINVRQATDKIEHAREGLRRIVEMIQSNCLGLGRSKYATASCDEMRSRAQHYLETGDHI